MALVEGTLSDFLLHYAALTPELRDKVLAGLFYNKDVKDEWFVLDNLSKEEIEQFTAPVTSAEPAPMSGTFIILVRDFSTEPVHEVKARRSNGKIQPMMCTCDAFVSRKSNKCRHMVFVDSFYN